LLPSLFTESHVNMESIKAEYKHRQHISKTGYNLALYPGFLLTRNGDSRAEKSHLLPFLLRLLLPLLISLGLYCFLFSINKPKFNIYEKGRKNGVGNKAIGSTSVMYSGH